MVVGVINENVKSSDVIEGAKAAYGETEGVGKWEEYGRWTGVCGVVFRSWEDKIKFLGG